MSVCVKTRPGFINVGPGRCASSWLLEALESHPDIVMARIKETEFFNTNYDKGYQWYENLFPSSDAVVVGEISNCYYVDPNVPERIRQYEPGMKIIVNVRDPFSLLRSFHVFGLRRGLKLGSLAEDLQFPIGRIMGSGYEQREKRNALTAGDQVSLIDAVMLSRHLKPYLESWPRDQLYIFVFERLKTERDKVLRELYEFLEVDPNHTPPVADTVVNAGIVPKSKWLARLATEVAYFLRRVGAYGVLDKLKKSRVLKQLFFSPSDGRRLGQHDLDAETHELLQLEKQHMIKLYPPLQKWWSADSSSLSACCPGNRD